MSLRRNSDCLVIQPSDMIVIDYPDYQKIPVHHQSGAATSSYPHPSQYSHQIRTSHQSSNNNCYEPSTSTANNRITPFNNLNTGPTISATVRRPFYKRVPSPAPSSLTSDGTLSFQQNSSYYVREESPSNYFVSPPPRPPSKPPHLIGRRAPATPVSSSSRPNSLSETCSIMSSCASTIDVIPTSSTSSTTTLQQNGLSTTSRTTDRRSFHHEQTSDSSVSYAIYQNHLPVAPSKPSTFNVNLPIENTSNMRRCSSPSSIAQIAQQPIMGDGNYSGSLSNCSQATQITHNQSNSSLSDSGRPPTVFIRPQPSSSNTTSSTSSVFARSRENGSAASSGRRPSFANSSNFQRLSKLRMNFNRWESEDVSGATTVKVRAFPTTANQFVHNQNSNRFVRARSTASSSTNEGDDFSGLPETAVDSDDDEDDDEESCPSHDSQLNESLLLDNKDGVRECLEKQPRDRTEEDIAILMDFMQQMPALANLPESIKKQLCLKMGFAIVPKRGTIIMEHQEQIDSWTVIVNGAVEHLKPDGTRLEYRLGESFGVEKDPKIQYNVGEMRTLEDDCQFVLVEHLDYCAIMETLNLHIEREADTSGEVIREAERRVVGSQVELLITKALPDRLIQHLVMDDTENIVDTYFLEDFLLMYRVFVKEPVQIVEKLLGWFEEDFRYRDKVARIILLWVNNHFRDFEENAEMTKLLEKFENQLEKAQMHTQQTLLNITCSVKSKPRSVTLTRSTREQELSFIVLGGAEIGQGIFISQVEPNSIPAKNGLKRGDEILEINNKSFKNLTLRRALEILRESTHLSLNVKSNLMGFKEMLMHTDELTSSTQDNDSTDVGNPNGAMMNGNIAGRYYQKKNSVVHTPPTIGNGNRRSNFQLLPPNQQQCFATSPGPIQQQKHSWGAAAGARKQQQQQQLLMATSGAASDMSSIGSGSMPKSSMFEKLLTLLKGTNMGGEHTGGMDSADEAYPNALRASRSNPDISSHLHSVNYPLAANQRHSSFSAYHQPEQAVKIYRSDQSFRYLTVYPETTAKNIVQLALQEFGMNSSEARSLDWSLCECTVTREGVIKQRRLPDDMQNLAERIGLSSRFYLKNNTKSENLIPDELAPEVRKEARLSLYNLNAQFLATQLTLQDFAVFSSVEPTEYVNIVFELEEHGGWPQLIVFEKLFNREMWWVVTEICCERNVYRRSKLIKKFIKIARHCRELRNFNSMFAIVSGLEKPAVRRLTHSWERVSGKYMKMFLDIQQLMDPSRNMSKYRQHLAQVAHDPPVIPIYPILLKDLTFAHDGNPTFCGKLVNFEKLRFIARIIRSIARLSDVAYDIELANCQISSNNLDIGNTGTIRRLGAGPIGLRGATLSGGVPSQAPQSRKKLYERVLMLRKVKTYLAAMPTIDNESELDRLSLDCEPPAHVVGGGSGGMSSIPPARRRMPSPSPSSLSSHSSQSTALIEKQRMHLPKFGVESPQAVQKMLSLVQNSKVKSTNAAQVSTSNLPPPTSLKSLSPAPQMASCAATKKFSTGAFVAQIKRMPSFGGTVKDSSTSVMDLPPAGKF